MILGLAQNLWFLNASEPASCLQFFNTSFVKESAHVENFRKSPFLVYDSKKPRLLKTIRGGHMMSNEVDIFKLPQVLPQRDLFFGIGNNASWDIALRSGAKKIIFYDINYEPLILQRYFFRPLFEISESPAEFYKYLFLKESAKHHEKTTLKLIEEFDKWEDFAWFDDFQINTKDQRQKLREEVLQKIKNQSTDPEKSVVLDFVKKLQESLDNKEVGLFPDTRGSSYEVILNLFASRYFPEHTKLIYSLNTQETEKLYDENVTFLSSPENFQKMKNLILNAEYAVTSVESDFWKKYKTVAKSVTIYTSNIFEISKKTLSSEKIKSQFLDAFKESSLPVIHIETLGTKYIHTFHVEELK